jgi:hypothetical protein
MRNFFLVSVFILVVLSLTACKQTNSTLDTTELELQEDLPEDHIPQSYEPVSLEVAKKAIPFQPEFPAYLPYQYTENLRAKVDDWGNQEKVLLTVDYTLENPEETEEGKSFIVFEASNFQRMDQFFEDNQENEITLEDGTSAFFQTNDNVRILGWNKDDIQYFLNYFFLNEDNSQADDELVERQMDELVKVANSME